MKRVAKADLPRKTCAVCGRPFTWRKKWRRVWDEVVHCSNACRGRRRTRQAAEPGRPDEARR